MKCIVGQKREMTQVFTESGERIPVTKIQADNCFVVQIKTQDKDGYSAVKIGYAPKKKVIKSVEGINKKANTENLSKFWEYRTEEIENIKAGDVVNVASFEVGDKVDVQGVTKGRGFQGGVKRYNFRGSPASHGHKDQLRRGGSIGSGYPQKVFKGKRMPGQMGAKKNTQKGLEVIKVDEKENALFVKGSVPGANKGYVYIEVKS